MSGATTLKPAAASAGNWSRHEYQPSGNPWHSSSSGPAPCSTTCMRMPLAVTSRCWRSFTAAYRILLASMLTVILFLGSAAAIYFACEFFVNGVEWLGRKLGVGETATGTILAAFGTALPESAVTFVALVFGRTTAQKDISVGAALGGPLVLATISYAVVGFAMLWNRRRLGRPTHVIECESKKLRRDQAWFLCIFIVKVALGLLVFNVKPWLGTLFLFAYAVYLLRELRGAQVLSEHHLEPLKLRPKSDPGLLWPLLQTTLALSVIAVASQV